MILPWPPKDWEDKHEPFHPCISIVFSLHLTFVSVIPTVLKTQMSSPQMFLQRMYNTFPALGGVVDSGSVSLDGSGSSFHFSLHSSHLSQAPLFGLPVASGLQPLQVLRCLVICFLVVPVGSASDLTLSTSILLVAFSLI